MVLSPYEGGTAIASTSAPREQRPRAAVEIIRPAATVTLLLLGAASIGVAAWSLVHGGIGWDSRYDTQASLAVRSLDTSWPIARAYAVVPNTSEFYGVFIQQAADVLHAVFGGSTGRLQPDDPSTYLYQGIANLIVAVVAMTALGIATAIVSRSALAGAFVWALTLATPLWLGMSHVDFKDVPVAAGLTLVTAGLLLASSLSSRRRATAAGVLLAAPGGAIVLSTRAGAIVLLMALAVGAVIGIGASAGVRGSRSCRRRSPPSQRSRARSHSRGPRIHYRASRCCPG